MGDIHSQRAGQLRDELRPGLDVHGFGVDMANYDWVRVFVRDRKAREDIARFREQITEIQKLPIDKEELRATFREGLLQFKARRLAFLRGNIERAQRHEIDLFSPASAWHAFEAPVHWISFLDYDLTEEEFESLFKGLEQGISQKEKDKRISAAKKKIVELEILIEKELSPKERWFYYPDGERMPYPKGCRWTGFVKTWEEVASRHIGPVDINGFRVESAEESAAYGLLELGKVEKRTPLREGQKR